MAAKVIEVRPTGPLCLHVMFDDGVEGEVRFEPEHLYGVFEALRDPKAFNAVSCAEGFVSWPGDVDLAPDSMYEALKADGQWVLK
jgi:hypothetical protein